MPGHDPRKKLGDRDQPVTVEISSSTGVIVGDHGVISVHQHHYGTRTYTIDEFPTPSRPDTGWLMAQPSRLLDARSQVVPFIGRETELQQLRDWRDSTEARLSVLLLHAPGGQGKSRLAAEFAEESRRQELPAARRWQVLQAGFHSAPPGAAERATPSPSESVAGILLIVDYADRWAHSELERLFSDPLLHQRQIARVLLIGRTVRWYAALRGELADRRATAGDLRLLPLTGDRLSMFTAARDRYGEPDLYDLPYVTGIQPPSSLEHRDFGLALTLHMAALVAVDAHQRGQRPPSEPHELSAYLLDREFRAWQRLYDAGGHGRDYRTRPAVMARTVFAAALTGAVSHDAGTEALRVLDLPGHPQDLLDDHRFCYPPADRELVLEPLYPDRLAEDFLGLLVPGHDFTAYDPDPWATSVPATLLAGSGGLRQAVVGRAVAFLASTASRWPHLSQKVLYPLLRADPSLAIDAGSAALTAVADIDEIPTDVLESISRLLPVGQHVDLDVGAAAVTEALMPRLLGVMADPEGRALLHLDYSSRLSYVGRWAEALEEAERALEYYTELAEGDRAAHLPGLALCVSTYASRLATVGRRAEALEQDERALEYDTQLAESGYTARLPALAGSLADHARLLAGSGRREEALGFSQRAVDLHEELLAGARTVDRADHDPGTQVVLQSGLALSLAVHAEMLAASKRLDEALGFSRRAVDLSEELAAGDPAGHLAKLADLFDRHSWWLAEAGRREEALDFSRRALVLRENLAAVNRGAHVVNLAASVLNYANRLAEAGRREEALDFSRRAVDLNEELIERDRDAYLPTVAVAMSNHAAYLAEAGRRAEALEYSRRALELREELAERDRPAHLPDLAASVYNHAKGLMDVGRGEEALGFSRHAVDLREELAARDRAAHLRGLLWSTHNHAVWLSLVGRESEAQHFSRRALELREELDEGHRAARLPDLATLGGGPGDGSALALPGMARQLTRHASQLAWEGRQADALDFSRRAVEHYRRLADDARDTYLPDLAAVLSGFARLSVTLNTNLADALPAAEQAFHAYQQLAAREPEKFTDTLLDSAKTLTDALKALGRAKEAEQIHRDLARRSGGMNARGQ